jgi:hypothetical protein
MVKLSKILIVDSLQSLPEGGTGLGKKEDEKK